MTKIRAKYHPNWGGHRKNQEGRPPKEGYRKLLSMRFLSKEEEDRIKKAIPDTRKRVQIFLQYIKENSL